MLEAWSLNAKDDSVRYFAAQVFSVCFCVGVVMDSQDYLQAHCVCVQHKCFHDKRLLRELYTGVKGAKQCNYRPKTTTHELFQGAHYLMMLTECRYYYLSLKECKHREQIVDFRLTKRHGFR